MAGISLRSVSKRFGESRAVREISLEITDGEFLSLVGPSGCGKSTLLRLIAGLERPDEGGIFLDAREVTARTPAERNVAMVFQNYALYPHMTAGANIEVPLAARRLSLVERLPGLRWLSPRGYRVRREIRAEVADLARSLEIHELLARKPGQLSGGQRQRVALARAMIREPVCFLMDEPLSNLDAKLRVQLRAEITALHRKLGTTFVYVTHDQAEAMSMSSRLAVMMAGRILQIGTPLDLYAAPAEIEVARFIGSPAINEVAGVMDAAGRVTVPGSGATVLLAPTGGASPEGPVTLGARPEVLALEPEPVAGQVVLAEARVESVELLGAEAFLHLQGGADGRPPWIVRLTAAAHAELAARGGLGEGAHLLTAAPADLHVFDAKGHRLGSARARA